MFRVWTRLILSLRDITGLCVSLEESRRFCSLGIIELEITTTIDSRPMLVTSSDHRSLACFTYYSVCDFALPCLPDDYSPSSKADDAPHVNSRTLHHPATTLGTCKLRVGTPPSLHTSAFRVPWSAPRSLIKKSSCKRLKRHSLLRPLFYVTHDCVVGIRSMRWASTKVDRWEGYHTNTVQVTYTRHFKLSTSVHH